METDYKIFVKYDNIDRYYIICKSENEEVVYYSMDTYTLEEAILKFKKDYYDL